MKILLGSFIQPPVTPSFFLPNILLSTFSQTPLAESGTSAQIKKVKIFP
jgi:hypothetical protein